jgi:hypothetical protein
MKCWFEELRRFIHWKSQIHCIFFITRHASLHWHQNGQNIQAGGEGLKLSWSKINLFKSSDNDDHLGLRYETRRKLFKLGTQQILVVLFLWVYIPNYFCSILKKADTELRPLSGIGVFSAKMDSIWAVADQISKLARPPRSWVMVYVIFTGVTNAGCLLVCAFSSNVLMLLHCSIT